jgi:uncharacterized protein YbcV (DUF1398 family)
MKFPAQFITLVLVGLFIIIGTQLTLAVPSGEIPEVTRSCIPETAWRYKIGQVRFLAQTRYQGVDYYLFHLVPTNSEPFSADRMQFPHVVSSSNRSCEVIYSNPSNDENWLSDSMPQAVANQFTLARYRFYLAQAGADKFEQNYLPFYQQSESPESDWALEQLGFSSASPSNSPATQGE